MIPRRKVRVTPLILILIASSSIAMTSACRNHRHLGGGGEAEVEPAGEPQQYSATVVRTIEDGTARETIITREARSGEKRRVEWTEQGRNRALIFRPDLGRTFLLDLDGRSYVEMETNAAHSFEFPTPALDSGSSSISENRKGADAAESFVQAIDHYFDDIQSPETVETRMLATETIDGHPCRVFEARAVFPDGHTEITRRYRAEEFAGLALRIEGENGKRGATVTTDRRDVLIDVAPEAFTVPADFKKVESLAAKESVPAPHPARPKK